MKLFFSCCCRAGEDNGAVYPSVEDSQEVCTTSFSTSPPSQVRETKLLLLLDRTITVRVVCILLHQLLCKQAASCCSLKFNMWVIYIVTLCVKPS